MVPLYTSNCIYFFSFFDISLSISLYNNSTIIYFKVFLFYFLSFCVLIVHWNMNTKNSTSLQIDYSQLVTITIHVSILTRLSNRNNKIRLLSYQNLYCYFYFAFPSLHQLQVICIIKQIIDY